MAMTAQRRTIRMALPGRVLNPNGRPNRFDKAKATKAYRQSAHALALAVDNSRPMLDSAKLSLRFYWPTRGRRDTLNFAAAMKPAIDGLVDAGWIEDDHWRVLDVEAIECELDKDDPRVELTIEPTD